MGDGPVLLTGAAGLLGQWLQRTALPSTNLVALAHRRVIPGVTSVQADLRSAVDVAAAMTSVDPTLVVHAAYAKDRDSIVGTTRHVVDWANAVGAHVLFISTDAVFLGDGCQRDERAPPDTTWEYGRWKAVAERIVLDDSEHGSIVRLPLLVSIDPADHVVRELLAAAANHMHTRWFTDEMRWPAFACDVATAIWRIAALPAAERQGCWHLAGAERPSRFEIALLMIDRLRLPGTTIRSAARPEGSERPRDIAFTDARARARISWRPSHLTE